MYTGNLSKGVLKPYCVGIDRLFNEFCLSFFEGLSLLGQFTLHPAKLHLLIGGPFLKFGHLGLGASSSSSISSTLVRRGKTLESRSVYS